MKYVFFIWIVLRLLLSLLQDSCGNSRGITPKSLRAVSERYKPRVFFETCTIWRVVRLPIVIRNITEPMMSRPSCVMPCMRWLVGTKYETGQCISSRNSRPPLHVWHPVSARPWVLWGLNASLVFPYHLTPSFVWADRISVVSMLMYGEDAGERGTKSSPSHSMCG